MEMQTYFEWLRLRAKPETFPNLTLHNFQPKSQRTGRYNCIAWAMGDDRRWWWPHPRAFWPPGVPREETLEAFEKAFAKMGFEVCDTSEPEDGYEKVALYALDGVPKHGARQLNDGRWTSKLGQDIDIEHALGAISGGDYGQAVKFFRRADE